MNIFDIFKGNSIEGDSELRRLYEEAKAAMEKELKRKYSIALFDIELESDPR